MQQSTTKPEEYLASLPDGVREDMIALDATISAAMDGLPKVVWEGRFWGGSEQRIIGYGEYRYTGRSGKSGEWFICGLAAQKNYITVFVNAVDDEAYLAESYRERLGKVKVGRSSISFKRLSDIDLEALKELVVRARDLMSGGSLTPS